MRKILPFILIAMLVAQCTPPPPEKISLLDLFVRSDKTDSIDYYLKQFSFDKANGNGAKKKTEYFQKISGDSSVVYYTENDTFTYGRFTIKNFVPERFGIFEKHVMDLNKFDKIEGDIFEDGKSYHTAKQYDLYLCMDSANLFMEVFLDRKE